MPGFFSAAVLRQRHGQAVPDWNQVLCRDASLHQIAVDRRGAARRRCDRRSGQGHRDTLVQAVDQDGFVAFRAGQGDIRDDFIRHIRNCLELQSDGAGLLAFTITEFSIYGMLAGLRWWRGPDLCFEQGFSFYTQPSPTCPGFLPGPAASSQRKRTILTGRAASVHACFQAG